jgi:predicted HAD superfamily Cof-like phosphohydrolase
MDHDYINEHGVVALYVAGRLSPEERAGFEEHFVDCRQCLEQIEVTGELRDGLRQVAKEDAARAGVAPLGDAPQVAPALWVGPGSRNPRGLLAYAMVVVVGLGAIFFVDARYRRSEVAEARRTSEDWQRRYAEEQQAREELQDQLAQAADRTPDNARKPGGEQTPMVASLQPAPLFFLNVTRGADEGSTPVNRVAVSPAAPLIALSLEFEKDSAFRSYRARLIDASGRVVWSAENIPSPASDAIAVTLPSRLLGRGNYSVSLDGLRADGRYLPAAHFTFQASLQR